MEGKVVLITGGTDGIGKATAIGLANTGAEVIVLGHDQNQGVSAVEEIKTKAGNMSISFLHCDLSSQQAVRQAAEQFKKDHNRLDVLINNAGVFLPKRMVTADGIEATFAINYLSHFLLTHLLLDLLKASAPARIINVTNPQNGLKINFDDLSFEQGFSTMKAVGQSKLALVLFTKTLAKKLEGTSVTVNSLFPGLTRTKILDKVNPLMRMFIHLMSGTPEKGARTSIYLATSPEVEKVTGIYFFKSKPKKTTGLANDSTTEQKLWDISQKLTHLT